MSIRNLLADHVEWQFNWTPREGNYAAHNLAHCCKIQNMSGIISVADLPDAVTGCDFKAQIRLGHQ